MLGRRLTGKAALQSAGARVWVSRARLKDGFAAASGGRAGAILDPCPTHPQLGSSGQDRLSQRLSNPWKWYISR